MVDDEFLTAYPTTPTIELSRRFGISEEAVRLRASRAGVKKDPEYRRQVQRQNATGRVVPAESKEKSSAKARGRGISEETKAKILATKRRRGTLPKGETHYKWKGGKPWERFRNPDYLAWRKAVLERDGYKCCQCKRQCKKHEKGLAAHHIEPYTDYPMLRYDVSNGVTMCRDCHMALHGKEPEPKEPVPCAYGCGAMITPVDRYGRPHQYINHHNARGRKHSDSTKRLLSEQRKGRKLTPEHRAAISDGLRRHTRWARNFDACQKCGTTERRHLARGLCTRCYQH